MQRACLLENRNENGGPGWIGYWKRKRTRVYAEAWQVLRQQKCSEDKG
jgi:hypothetical protein